MFLACEGLLLVKIECTSILLSKSSQFLFHKVGYLMLVMYNLLVDLNPCSMLETWSINAMLVFELSWAFAYGWRKLMQGIILEA
jgi:hypothetical protein